jgi:hypothetical protein
MDYQPMDYMFGRLQDEAEQEYTQVPELPPVAPPPEAPQPAAMQEAPAQQMTLEEQQAADNDRLRKQLAMVDERMKIMGLTGGGRRPIGMNELQKEGFRLREGALQDVIPVAEREAGVRAGLMKESQDTSKKYVADLQTLQDKQRSLFDARKAAMQQDEAAMRQSQDSFDASRLLRDLSNRPVDTAILSFTAGLVGMLKGSAGRRGPNDVLQEVDKAIERDIQNQKTQYDRMLQGQTVRRNNFLDARQMGADEQHATALAATASLDQHARALDFASQRVADAKTSAALKEASGNLKGQQGDLQMRIDEKNAAAAAAAFRSVQDMRMKLLAGMQNVGQVSPELLKEARSAYPDLVKSHKEELSKLEAVGKLASAVAGSARPDQIRAFWSSAVTPAVNEVLQSKMAQSLNDSKAYDVLSNAIMRKILDKAITPEQRKVASALQGVINRELRVLSGGAVTNNEIARKTLEDALYTFDSFNNYVNNNVEMERRNMGALVESQKSNPAMYGLLMQSVGVPLMALDEYNRVMRAEQAARAVVSEKAKRK